jgi:hypothetical protein
MKHIRRFISLFLVAGVIVTLYLPGCKKDNDTIQGPVTPSGNASGDLGGSYPSPTVSKLQGRALSAIAPTQGQALAWNNTTSLWEPTTLAGLGIWQSTSPNIFSLHTGNLGLGTSTPNDEIHILKDVNSFVGLTIENKDPGGSSTERISFTDENGSLAYIQLNDDGSISGPSFTVANNRPNGIIHFNTGGTQRVTISNAGSLGVGTTNPAQKLHVVGNICATGSIGACSDIRYKTNILSLTNALSAITSLHGIYYNWDKKKIGKDAYTKERQIGFSAQEIEQYFPEIVQTDSKGYKAIDYSRLTPILTEAIKEQQQTIDQQRELLNQQQEQVKQIYRELASMKTQLKELNNPVEVARR